MCVSRNTVYDLTRQLWPCGNCMGHQEWQGNQRRTWRTVNETCHGPLRLWSRLLFPRKESLDLHWQRGVCRLLSGQGAFVCIEIYAPTMEYIGACIHQTSSTWTHTSFVHKPPTSLWKGELTNLSRMHVYHSYAFTYANFVLLSLVFSSISYIKSCWTPPSHTVHTSTLTLFTLLHAKSRIVVVVYTAVGRIITNSVNIM
jgi:hypothetical protein